MNIESWLKKEERRGSRSTCEVILKAPWRAIWRSFESSISLSDRRELVVEQTNMERGTKRVDDRREKFFYCRQFVKLCVQRMNHVDCRLCSHICVMAGQKVQRLFGMPSRHELKFSSAISALRCHETLTAINSNTIASLAITWHFTPNQRNKRSFPTHESLQRQNEATLNGTTVSMAFNLLFISAFSPQIKN